MSVASITIAQNKMENFTPSNNTSIIRQVALQALKELAIALAGVALCAPFIASLPWNGLMAGIATLSTLVNAAIRFAAMRFFEEKGIEQYLLRTIQGTVFAYANGTNVETLLHESGHVIAAKTVFQCSPKIKLNPYQTSTTTYTPTALTPIGTKWGYDRSTMAIAIAGPSLALLAATIAFIAGMALRKSHPDLGAYLIASGSLVYFGHAQYAFTAISAPKTLERNDFVQLKNHGIHPLAAIATIIAVPLIITGGFLLGEYLHHSKAKTNIVT